jgi:hypothetical protein
VRRRAAIGIALALVAWLVVANHHPATAAPAADWTHPRTLRTAGLDAVFPRAWHASAHGSTLVIWSLGDPNARSAEKVNRIPAGGVWIWLIDYGRMERTNGFMPRTRQFELKDEDVRFQSCGFGFDGWNLTFVDHGHAVQAIIGLGRGARKEDVTKVLDGLRIST